jgi:CubicO group peptidase (beta-lactamase class C family)
MRKISLAIIFIGSFLVAFEQPAKWISRLDGSKISSAALTDTIRQIVDSSKIEGLSVVIITGDQIVYQQAFGDRNREKHLSLDDTTAMYAASFTKPVSAYLFLKLCDQGLFSLDTPVIRYLKRPIRDYEKWHELAQDSSLFDRVTARMILSHSSGLPILRVLYGDKLRLIAVPGKNFYYSNEGMNLLGFVIEEYTGVKLEALARQHIFSPLGMDHTSMIWESSFEKNYALGYDRSDTVTGMGKRTAAKAAGSMTTTAADYALFLRALMQGKGISEKYFRQMMSPQIPVTSTKGFGPGRDRLAEKWIQRQLSWGLGVGLFPSGYGPAFFHAGHDKGWQNYFVAYPGKKIAVVLMSNSSNFEAHARELLKFCIKDVESPLEWLGYFDGND